MADMLVRLYALPDAHPLLAQLAEKNIHIRRSTTGEKYVLLDWVNQRFNRTWASGCEAALTQQPVSCFIAVKHLPANAPPHGPYDLPPEQLLGFACYNVASKGMFGAMGVDEAQRRQGIGSALLLASLHAMRDEGYAYAVIGWAGSPEFYARAAGATIIPDSEPSIFRGPLVDSTAPA